MIPIKNIIGVYIGKKWEDLCRPKVEGGLGFWEFEAFNFALLAKQGLRLIKNSEFSVARVLKVRYDAQSNFMNVRIGTGASFVWRSILEALELLKQGLRWRIGNTEQVQV